MNGTASTILQQSSEPVAVPALSAAARASLVNRTHRVVRERAQGIASRRSLIRSLWLPLAVCSGLSLILCTAVWTLLDAYDINPLGIPDSGGQFLVLLLWFLPLSMALMAMIWFRGLRAKRAGGEFTR